MKAVSIRQPWPWAILHAGKRIENRTRLTRYRGPLLLHAGLSRRELAGTTPRDWHRLMPGLPPFDRLIYGALVGVAELTDSVRAEDRPDLARDPFAEGPVYWLLGDVRPLTRPIPWRGVLGLFEVPDAAVASALIPPPSRRR